ncbi:MAG: FKBP-type peptidyl-prolyl cis-trans isomerase [Bacteroidales bacterium]|nr:FKBP-type peptidyl-prolyl cis-trans isomerase [Bacteroidales bacterium]
MKKLFIALTAVALIAATASCKCEKKAEAPAEAKNAEAVTTPQGDNDAPAKDENTETVSNPAKAQGEEFLAQMAKDPDVKATGSGLMYKVIREGTGKKPKATDKVYCHYEGSFPDGTVFDSSYMRGEPIEFGLNQVIKGWTEGLQLMSEGAKYELYLPYHLAYGESGTYGIPPYSALKFVVELIEVR